jgi:hypothetical protein
LNGDRHGSLKPAGDVSKTVMNRINVNLMGADAPDFMIAEPHFTDQAAFDTAMASPENPAAGKAVMSFPEGLVTALAATGS